MSSCQIVGVGLDVVSQELDAFLRVKIDDLYTERAQPIEATLKILALADDKRAKTELANQAAAIPARGESGDHNEVAVTALAAGFAKRIGFAVDGGIVLLNAAVVTGAQKLCRWSRKPQRRWGCRPP